VLRHLPFLAAIALLGLLPCGPALGVTVDGTCELEYGTALSTQTTQTSYEDQAVDPAPDASWGSELDEAYGFIADGVLHLFVSGNVGFCCPIQYAHQELLDVFVDMGPGGQGVLLANNPSAIAGEAGLSFDVGFEPDHWFLIAGGTTTVDYAELPAGGGGNGFFLGRDAGDGQGTLIGGTNPDGVRVSVASHNVTGVTHGCDASSGAGATTGAEMAIPLTMIGNPTAV
jgi:hypothetical protein